MRRVGLSLLVFLLSACARESGPVRSPVPAGRGEAATRPSSLPDTSVLAEQFQAAPALATLEGDASYYSDRLAGHATASGEPYRPGAFTAAHRSLPLGTVLRVSRADGTRTVYVRVNDRGPYARHRILDLSRAAARQLDMLRAGVLSVRAEVVAYGPSRH